MYQTETNWFSQTIQTYNDKIYGTEGYLRVAISTNSDDHKSYNSPKLNIMIKNNHQKALNLSGENALELATSLGQAIKNFNGEKVEIVKKFRPDLQFVIEMFQHDGKELVKLTLLSNSSDFTVIIIPLFPTFILFGKNIKEFSNNYFNLCQNMFLQTFNSYHKEIIMQLPGLLKSLGTSIQLPLEQEEVDIDKEVIQNTEVTIGDLDNYLGKDMENIKVPEIDNHKIEEKEIKVNFIEVDSKFITNILKDDFSNFENMISGMTVSHDPITSFMNRLSEDGGFSDSFKPLPGISDDDLKSIVYLSRITFLMYQKGYIEYGSVIPQSFSPISYKATDYTEENINLAYDLLLFSGYIRALRSKIESKVPNAVENKSIFHMAFRCFIDPFIFSFINKDIEKEQLISIILNRFKCYDERGIFDKYKVTLKSFGFDNVNENDIKSFINTISSAILGPSQIPTIDKLHKSGFESGNLRLSSQNDFNLEQITNEIIPLEVSVKLNNNEVTDDLIKKIKIKENLSDEVIDFFKKKVTKVSKKEDEVSNLVKFLDNENFKEQVPEKYRDDFFNYIAELKNNDFVLSELAFPYEQFGDDIIKVLYLWKPSEDEKLTKNIKHLRDLFGSCLQDRSTIVARELSESSKPESSFEFNINDL